MRRAVVLAVVALLLAACGEQARPSGTGDPSPAARHAALPARAGAPWLVRFDAYGGPDGESRQATYVTITPQDGKASTVTMPMLTVPEASGDERVLLVDAGHRWALADTRVSKRDRARGLVTVTDLRTGKAHDLQVRADWASFDPRQPGLLRVVRGRTVSTVAVDGGDPHAESVLPRKVGWIFGGGFDKNSGTPYIEDTASFHTLPAGNGDLDARPVQRDGGRLVAAPNGRYRGLPSPQCEQTTGFRDADGRSWAFCVTGTAVSVKLLGKDGHWERLGTARDVVPANADIVFVLPPA